MLAGRNGRKRRIGLAEDTSDAAISCQQVGPIELSDKIKNGKVQERWFQKRTSLIFKSLQAVRFYDEKRNTRLWSGLFRQKWSTGRRRTPSARCHAVATITGKEYAANCRSVVEDEQESPIRSSGHPATEARVYC